MNKACLLDFLNVCAVLFVGMALGCCLALLFVETFLNQ